MGTTTPTNPSEMPANDVVQDALHSTKMALAAGQRAIEDIEQMQHKVERSLDWRAQVAEHPWVMIGMAALGGILLSAMIGGRDRR